MTKQIISNNKSEERGKKRKAFQRKLLRNQCFKHKKKKKKIISLEKKKNLLQAERTIAMYFFLYSVTDFCLLWAKLEFIKSLKIFSHSLMRNWTDFYEVNSCYYSGTLETDREMFNFIFLLIRFSGKRLQDAVLLSGEIFCVCSLLTNNTIAHSMIFLRYYLIFMHVWGYLLKQEKSSTTI